MHGLGQNSLKHKGNVYITVYGILVLHRFYTYFNYYCSSGDKTQQSPFDRWETDQVIWSKSERQNYPYLQHMKSEWL